MKIEETITEGKGVGDVEQEAKQEVKEELEKKVIEPEDKYNHLLNLTLDKSEGHFKQFVVDTIKTISGEGKEVKAKDGEKYRVWSETKEEDFGNIIFNIIMNLGIIYNKVCSVPEDSTIKEAFAIPSETPETPTPPPETPQNSDEDNCVNPVYDDTANEPIDVSEI